MSYVIYLTNSKKYLKMASREEWCTDKLSKLLQEDLRVSTLNEIKEYLTSIPQAEASKTASVLELPLVFDCLNDSNKEQVDLSCEVLSLCMSSLSLGESTSKYDVYLERALNHPFSAVKIMALNEIGRNISKEEPMTNLCRKISLLKSVVRCIGDNDVAVATKASDILVVLGLSTLGLKSLMSSDVMEVLNDIISINEIVRLRVYEMIMNICKESELNFKLLRSSGLFSQILEELNSNDVLLRMNIVEILTQFGLSRHGFNYLEQNGILNKLFAFIEDNDDPLTVQLCEPGILRFFGNMAHQKPIELLSKYPKLFDRLFGNIESGDLIIVRVSLDTLGIIGLTNEGKCALHSTGNKIIYAIKIIVKLLASLPTEVRLRALNCLENLLRITEYTNDVTKITRQWYGLFSDEPMTIILRYAKNPFSEIKLAGLGILHAMAEQQWGQEEIAKTPGLVEYLLDRTIETNKDCKEMKYEIVKALAVSTLLDPAILSRIQTFVKEGPFFVQAMTDIAFEGDD